MAALVLAATMGGLVAPAGAHAAPTVSDSSVVAANEAADPTLLDTYWVMEWVVDGDQIIPLPKDPQPYLILRSTEALSAFNGCNWLNGTVQVRDNTLFFGDLGSTKKLCVDYSTQLEIAVFAALDSGQASYRIESGRLRISRPDGFGLLLRYEPSAR